MEPNRTPAKGAWQKLSATPVYTSWSGLAFENLCMKHIDAIEKKLGIKAIYTENSSWRGMGSDANSVQIDLLIDRRDQCINLCEMKFYSSEVAIDKKLATELRHKETAFREHTKSKKQLFTTLVTTFNLIPNEHSIGLIDSVVTMDDLFVEMEER